MRRLNRSQVEIFNFSFLDILACTIALLIFIMVMVFVLQSGSSDLADTSKSVDRNVNRATEIESLARSDDRIADQLEENIAHLAQMVDHKLLNARTGAKKERDSIQNQYDHDQDVLATLTQDARDGADLHSDLTKRVAQINIALEKARTDYAKAQKLHGELLAQVADDHILIRPANAPGDPAAGSSVLHIDCQRDKVVVMRLPANGDPQVLGTTPVDSLDAADSAFAAAVQEHRTAVKPVIVFWVRPDGLETFAKAREQVPTGVDYGYEPAGADWHFTH